MKFYGQGSSFKRYPMLNIRDKVGLCAIISLQEPGREVKGVGTFWEVQLWHTDAELMNRNSDKSYSPATAKTGDVVSLNAPAQLNRALSEALEVLGKDAKLKITYAGQKKMKTQYGTKDAHQFDVESAEGWVCPS